MCIYIYKYSEGYACTYTYICIHLDVISCLLVSPSIIQGQNSINGGMSPALRSPDAKGGCTGPLTEGCPRCQGAILSPSQVVISINWFKRKSAGNHRNNQHELLNYGVSSNNSPAKKKHSTEKSHPLLQLKSLGYLWLLPKTGKVTDLIPIVLLITVTCQSC